MPINYDTLHKLYLSRPTARALFGSIDEAGVEAGRTTVDELIKANTATRRQAITLLRDLDEAGCGEFKVGRKGHPSRLEWSGDASEIVRRAISGELSGAASGQGDIEQAQELPADPGPQAQNRLEATSGGATQAALALPMTPADVPESPRPADRARKSARASSPAEHAGDDQIQHTYVLRADSRVSVALPANLTRREAEVLADWVRNLSFER